MGLGKTIRKWLGAADGKAADALQLKASETRKRLKTVESALKEAEKRIVDLEETLAVVSKRLEYAEASGTIEGFGWVAESTPEGSAAKFAEDLAAYLKARGLPNRMAFIGGEDAALAASLRRADANWEIEDGIPEKPVSLCAIGSIPADGFEESVKSLFGRGLLAEGALLRVPSARHAGLLNPILSTIPEAPRWMPWRFTTTEGAWLLIWNESKDS
ncbi:MAG: hypothetical protein KDM91_07055 [Verrucomicrobiae bacterium]|nr:hypothetical protein [Verrucomicrobiae bacterium]